MGRRKQTAHQRASLNYQRKQRQNGRCPKCGEPAKGYYCDRHKAEDAARKKAANAKSISA
jgi:hypothetical protein